MLVVIGVRRRDHHPVQLPAMLVEKRSVVLVPGRIELGFEHGTRPRRCIRASNDGDVVHPRCQIQLQLADSPDSYPSHPYDHDSHTPRSCKNVWRDSER
nr:hypothetical protein [Haladaptatus sp. R4]